MGFGSSHIIDYPSPVNLTYMWGFGLLSGLFLLFQVITGIFLSMYYVADSSFAVESVGYIMRDVHSGWFIRYFHSNGASMFFIVVYIHMFRGLYYGSYAFPRTALWVSGVVIFFVMIITGFIGYVLPWGQMSFWGATVITNLVTVIPFVGLDIAEWLWGGWVVGNPTLKRFYSIHYVLPFLIVGLVFLHLSLLHFVGSSNPVGVKGGKIPFYPYYYVKDLFGFVFTILLFSYLVYYVPNVLNHADNSIVVNTLKTPEHIVPEWYFLAFYAVLRSITDKTLGVVGMVLSILSLILISFYSLFIGKISSVRFIYNTFFWFFSSICVLLVWLGQSAAVYPYVGIGKFFTFMYFVVLCFTLPFLTVLDSKLVGQVVAKW